MVSGSWSVARGWQRSGAALAAEPGADAPDDDAEHGDDDAGGADEIEHAVLVGRLPPHHVKCCAQDSQEYWQRQPYSPGPHHRRDHRSCSAVINDPGHATLRGAAVIKRSAPFACVAFARRTHQQRSRKNCTVRGKVHCTEGEITL